MSRHSGRKLQRHCLLAFYRLPTITSSLKLGARDATGNDRTRSYGCEHGATTTQRWPFMCRLRYVAESRGGTCQGKSYSFLIARRFREEGGKPAGHLVDGTGGGCR